MANYIPALGFRWLTPLYDPVLRLTLRERRFKGALVTQVALKPGHRALDLGCGTGTLTLLLQQSCPGARVSGLDGDPEVLEIAQRKAAAAGVALDLRQGMSFDPPFAAASFDRVVSSLLLHHLTTDDKRRTLAAALALLRPGGELHLADWGRAANPLMRAAYLGIQLLDGFATTADNVRGLLPDLMRGAGFTDVEETRRFSTVFGSLSLYRAARPA